MPDDDFRGKRLHLIRLAAAGMGCHIPATKEAYDEAEQLVDRVVAMAPPPAPLIAFGWRLFGFAALATFGVCLIVLALLPGGAR